MMDSTIIVALIGGAVTIFNVVYSTAMAQQLVKNMPKSWLNGRLGGLESMNWNSYNF